MRSAATTTVALWFDRRRGTALGLVSAIGTSMISLVPILLERSIAVHGWRTTWLVEGITVLVLILPADSLQPKAAANFLPQTMAGLVRSAPWSSESPASGHSKPLPFPGSSEPATSEPSGVIPQR